MTVDPCIGRVTNDITTWRHCRAGLAKLPRNTAGWWNERKCVSENVQVVIRFPITRSVIFKHAFSRLYSEYNSSCSPHREVICTARHRITLFQKMDPYFFLINISVSYLFLCLCVFSFCVSPPMYENKHNIIKHIRSIKTKQKSAGKQIYKTLHTVC